MSRPASSVSPMRAELLRAKPVPVAWWWLIAAMAGVALGLGWWSFDLQRQLREAQRQRAAMESARSATPVSTAPAPVPKPYEASAREMWAQATTPWPTALNAIESVQLPGVRVVRFEYSAGEARVNLQLQLREQRQAVEYVNELNMGQPAEGMAWRWTLSRVEADRSSGDVKADLVGSWRAK